MTNEHQHEHDGDSGHKHNHGEHANSHDHGGHNDAPKNIALNPGGRRQCRNRPGVAGMDCVNEIEALERVFRPLKGVREVRVNLMGGKVTLLHDESLNARKRIDAIAPTRLKVEEENSTARRVSRVRSGCGKSPSPFQARSPASPCSRCLGKNERPFRAGKIFDSRFGFRYCKNCISYLNGNFPQYNFRLHGGAVRVFRLHRRSRGGCDLRCGWTMCCGGKESRLGPWQRRLPDLRLRRAWRGCGDDEHCHSGVPDGFGTGKLRECG